MNVKGWVIGIDRDMSRENVQKLRDWGLFSNEKIPFASFIGVDGKKVFPTDDAIIASDRISSLTKLRMLSKAKRFIGEICSVGEFGCATSHRLVSEEFLKTDADWAIIMEDDSKFYKKFKQVSSFLDWILSLIQKFPENADVVSFSYTDYRISGSKRKINSKIYTSLGYNFPLLKSKTGIFDSVDVLWGTGGYLINRNAAKIILSEKDHFDLTSDYFLSLLASLRRLNTYALNNSPLKQNILDPGSINHKGTEYVMSVCGIETFYVCLVFAIIIVVLLAISVYLGAKLKKCSRALQAKTK